MRCPECPTAVPAWRTFCTPAHKADWHNRQTVRGRVLTPLTMAARITRGGTQGDVETGKRARGDAEQMVQRWVVEDRAANRMSAVEYVAQRYKTSSVLFNDR